MKKFLILLCLFLAGISTYAQEGKKNKGFEMSIEANGGPGLDKCTKYSFGLNFNAGYRFNPYFYVGAGLGYSYIDGLYYRRHEYISYGKSLNYDSFNVNHNAQLFARLKANFTKTKVSPFISLDLGGTFAMTSRDIRQAEGFMYEPAFGLDFELPENQSLYMMLGYKGQTYTYRYFNMTLGNTYDEDIKYPSGLFNIHLGFKF